MQAKTGRKVVQTRTGAVPSGVVIKHVARTTTLALIPRTTFAQKANPAGGGENKFCPTRPRATAQGRARRWSEPTQEPSMGGQRC